VNKITTVLLMTTTNLFIASISHAQSNTLSTLAGNNIGLSLSSYQYREPDIMSSKGSKLGLDLCATRELQNNHFFRGDLRYAFGSVDYNGSGSASGQPDWYIEARGLLSKDWVINDAVFSPYIGLGYRYLSNDARGFTGTGAVGYRRESNYLYLPIGLTYRVTVNTQARLTTEVGYDHLLSGKQVSRLSDTGLGLSDVTNIQSTGYGLKLSVMYEKENWAIGPFAHYWNVGQSDIAVWFQNGIPVGTGVEPENNTVEFGLKARQRF
jgi:hypothetical protein